MFIAGFALPYTSAFIPGVGQPSDCPSANGVITLNDMGNYVLINSMSIDKLRHILFLMVLFRCFAIDSLFYENHHW